MLDKTLKKFGITPNTTYEKVVNALNNGKKVAVICSTGFGDNEVPLIETVQWYVTLRGHNYNFSIEEIRELRKLGYVLSVYYKDELVTKEDLAKHQDFEDTHGTLRDEHTCVIEKAEYSAGEEVYAMLTLRGLMEQVL